MKWIAVKTKQDRPKNNGIYFVKIRHSEMLPEEPDQKETCEIKNGRWQFATGWRVIEWLDESTPPVSAMEDGWVKELDDMVRQKDYWYNRCYQAELYIEKSPCDPDITEEQIEAHKLWEESKRPLPPPPSK